MVITSVGHFWPKITANRPGCRYEFGLPRASDFGHAARLGAYTYVGVIFAARFGIAVSCLWCVSIGFCCVAVHPVCGSCHHHRPGVGGVAVAGVVVYVWGGLLLQSADVPFLC
jgi:hypothetical protein